MGAQVENVLKYNKENPIQAKKNCIKDTMLYTNYDSYNAMQCNTNKLTFVASLKGKVKVMMIKE